MLGIPGGHDRAPFAQSRVEGDRVRAPRGGLRPRGPEGEAHGTLEAG